MESSVDYLSNLPVELFLHICSYLDTKKSLSALKCVCKRVYDILSDDLVWKSRIAGRWIPNERGIDVDWKEACCTIEVEASYLRDPITCDQLFYRKAHDSDIDALHILENHQTLLSGSRDGDLRIWNINRDEKVLEKVLTVPGAHNRWIWRIASEYSRQIFSCSFDHSLKYWELCDEKLTEIWSIDLKKPVMSLKIIDQNMLAAGLHSEVALIDRRKAEPIRHIFKDNHIKFALAMMGSHTLISNGANKKICLLDLRNDKEEYISFDFGTERPVKPMHLAVQQNVLYVSDGLSRVYAADITKKEPYLINGYFPTPPPEGVLEKVIGMYATYTSLILGVNYKKSGHLVFWRPKPALNSEDLMYPSLRKVGEMHNMGSFNELCGMHYRDGMVATACITDNDLVCMVPKEF